MIATIPHCAADPDMVSILQAYNNVTEKLKRSHETLFQEVQRLREELDAKNRELQRRERLAALGEMAAGAFSPKGLLLRTLSRSSGWGTRKSCSWRGGWRNIRT